MSSFALCQLDFTSCDFAQTPSLPSPFPFPPCRLSNATPPSIIIQCLLWAAKPRSPSDNLLKPAENNRLILGTLRQLIPLSSPSPNKVKTEEFDAVDKKWALAQQITLVLFYEYKAKRKDKMSRMDCIFFLLRGRSDWQWSGIWDTGGCCCCHGNPPWAEIMVCLAV